MQTNQIKPTREHHLHVAVSKYLFNHPKHGVIVVRYPMRVEDAKRYGLKPLILYGIRVPNTSIKWMTFTPLERPRPLLDFLQEAWRKADSLRGMPDIVKVNRMVAQACPNLAEALAPLGVRLVVADTKDKSHPGSLKSLQEACCCWSKLSSLEYGDDPIQNLCSETEWRLNNSLEHDREKAAPSMRAKIEEWLAIPVNTPVEEVGGGMDWAPGSWLWSWDATLPPAGKCYLKKEDDDHYPYLLPVRPDQEERECDDDDDDDGEYEESSFDGGYPNLAEVAKNVVACWPSEKADIAKSLGIKVRELQWFINGKVSLANRVRVDLEDMLCIGYNDNDDCYEIVDPCVLIASEPRAIEDIYNQMTSGGDACAYEVIPDQAAADPSWRFLLVIDFGVFKGIIMIPRGSATSEQMGNIFTNCHCETGVPVAFYRDVVSTCAKICIDPTINKIEMEKFVARYKSRWAGSSWEPEMF